MNLNILFTCAGRRNYLINYFKEAIGDDGKIFAADMSLSAPAMVDADVSLLVPSFYNENYIEELKAIIKKHNIKAIVSLNDLELPILAKHKTELEASGAKVIVSSENVIDTTFDKLKTFNFLKSVGLETPLTYTTLEDAKKALENKELDFPLVVKPRWGSASIGIDFPESIEELDLAFNLQKIKLKKSILNTVSTHDFDHAILIQEKIDGKEYGMDIVNNFECDYFGTFAREKYSMRGGETDKAVSIIDERFEKLGHEISNHLKHLGTLDCDIFVTKEKIYVLELNPRFGGGYPFSHEAGINTAAIYIEWLKGNKNVNHFNNYVSDKFFSKCDRLIELKST
nr:ATP-grasp domain-containing protein [uncultured Psychroserpens sp.]